VRSLQRSQERRGDEKKAERREGKEEKLEWLDLQIDANDKHSLHSIAL